MDLGKKNIGIAQAQLELLRQANRKAQQDLYNGYAPKMFAICMRYAASQSEAEDLLQEGFIKVFQYLHQYRGEGNFEGWMRRIFVNTAIEGIRKRNFWQKLGDSESNLESGSDLNGFENLSLLDLMKLIQGLSDGYRTVFNLYVIEGYSHKEIGELLNISEGTSKSQLSRAKAILQKTLIMQGIIA